MFEAPASLAEKFPREWKQAAVDSRCLVSERRRRRRRSLISWKWEDAAVAWLHDDVSPRGLRVNGGRWSTCMTEQLLTPSPSFSSSLLEQFFSPSLPGEPLEEPPNEASQADIAAGTYQMQTEEEMKHTGGVFFFFFIFGLFATQPRREETTKSRRWF